MLVSGVSYLDWNVEARTYGDDAFNTCVRPTSTGEYTFLSLVKHHSTGILTEVRTHDREDISTNGWADGWRKRLRDGGVTVTEWFRF